MSKLKLASILLLISTLILKFSSMIRDIVIANLFGDSYMASAYLAAMLIPNALILFMLTGMKEAFLPSYFKYDKEGKGFSHLTNIVKGTFWISVLLAIGGVLLSPFVIPILFPFNEHGTEIAIWTSVIYFFSVIFVGLNAVYEGFFDAQRKFSFSTLSQTIVVFSTIGGALILYKQLGIYGVPLGYLIGTILSFFIKLIYLRPKGFMDWKQSLDRQEVKAFYLIFMPVGLTIAVGQVNLLVNSLFASRLGESVVANLNYAFRLVNIPQAIFGVTIATIIFPILARAKSKDDMNLFKVGIEKGLMYMFLLLAPTVAGMLVLMNEFVQVVYERGAFSSEATALTSEYALFYVGSVLFYSIQAVIAKGFYTLEKGHYMLRIGIISIICNVIFNSILVNIMGGAGLALSASLVGFIYSAITFTTLYKLTGGFNISVVAKEYGKIFIATMFMVGSLIGLEYQFGLSRIGAVPYLIVMIIIGAVLYFIALGLLKTHSLFEILQKGRVKGASS